MNIIEIIKPGTLGDLENGFADGTKSPEQRRQLLDRLAEKKIEIAKMIVVLLLDQKPTFQDAISILDEAERIIRNQKIGQN